MIRSRAQFRLGAMAACTAVLAGALGPTRTVAAAPFSPTISTIQTVVLPTLPAIAPLFNDSATLAGGSSPTGTVTFQLFDPSNPTCSPTGTAAVFSQTTSVSGLSAATTNTTAPATVDGTWHWVATYNGDVNNNAVTSPCGSEAMVLARVDNRITLNNAFTEAAVSTISLGTYHDTGVADCTAVIDWGDGTTSPATLTPLGGGDLAVTGNHAYAEEGGYAVPGVGRSTDPDCAPVTTTVTTTNTIGGITFTTTVVHNHITDNQDFVSCCEPLNFFPTAIAATVGTPFSGLVTVFTDPDPSIPSASPIQETDGPPNGPPASYTATIDWGDTTSSTGTITFSGGLFNVAGTHTYSAAGSLPLKVTVADTDLSTGSSTGTAFVTSASILTISTVATATPTAPFYFNDTATLSGGSSPTGTVTFQLFDPSNPTCAPTGTAPVFTQTVGLSGLSAATTNSSVLPVANGLGSRWVASYSGDANNNAVTSPCNNELVSVIESTPIFEASNSFTEAAPATISLGVFHDFGTPDCTAVIHWGDGTTSPATLTPVGGGDLAVTGTHAYAEEAPAGQYVAGVTSTDPLDCGPAQTSLVQKFPVGGGAIVTLLTITTRIDSSSNTVNCCEPLAVTANAITATVGSPFTGTVGTFTDPDPAIPPLSPIQETDGPPNGPPASYTATIDWGDATTSTGTVTFSAGVFTVNGIHTYASAGSFPLKVTVTDTDLSTGTNSSTAVVSGKATPSISTTPNPTSAAPGPTTFLNDTATLTGGNSPTGTIDFLLFDPSHPTCPPQTIPAFSQTVSLSGLSAATTNITVPATTSGTWHWLAIYSGDANNASVISTCASEAVSVGQAAPQISTTPNPTTAIAGPSTFLNDSATLSGASSPTGTVTFLLFDPNHQSCSPLSSAAFSQTVNLSGLSAATNNTTVAATTTGTWHWLATYSGDPNNSSAGSSCSSEAVNVAGATLSIATTPNPTSATAGTSTFLNDSATLSGGSAPTGTVTFSLFDPTNPSCNPQGTAPVFVQTKALSAHLTASTANVTVPSTTVGTWHWVATYSGDSNNRSMSSGCAQEPVVVSAAGEGDKDKDSDADKDKENPPTGDGGGDVDKDVNAQPGDPADGDSD